MARKKIIIILIIVFIVISSLFIYFISPLNTNKKMLLKIKSGDTFHKVSYILWKNRIIKSRSFFLFLVKISGNSSKLKEGIYNISSNMSLFKIMDTLTTGNVVTKSFTIPEGYNIYQIADLLDKKGLGQKEEFLRLVHSKKIIKKYNINSTSLEGYLYPDTYTVPVGISLNDIINLMVKNFFIKVTPLMRERIKEKGYTLQKAIKLASLVEWEARYDFERPIITAVFLNRLKRGLNLASCATVLYAIGHHKKRLFYKDLKTNSLYNTYIYKGLPPTPICNPGKNSILAVIFPAKVNYLYFVSMKNGRHFFSTTYSQHLKAYKKYILNKE